MINATETLEQEWNKVTSNSFDETTKQHLNYAVKAMNKHACNVLDEFLKRVDSINKDYSMVYKVELKRLSNDLIKELCAE